MVSKFPWCGGCALVASYLSKAEASLLFAAIASSAFQYGGEVLASSVSLYVLESYCIGDFGMLVCENLGSLCFDHNPTMCTQHISLAIALKNDRITWEGRIYSLNVTV